MKELKVKIYQTHDVESKWNKLTELIPHQGEIIVYDPDEKHSYSRYKIGDGSTKLVDLEFSTDAAIIDYFNVKNNLIVMDAGRITSYKEDDETDENSV